MFHISNHCTNQRSVHAQAINTYFLSVSIELAGSNEIKIKDLNADSNLI